MVLAGVILASTISWFVVVTAVLQNWSMICSSGGLWSRGLPHALSMVGMWLAMALAMMLPSTTAEIVRIAPIHHGSQAKSPALRLGLSYLAIAMLVGLVAAALQSIFEPIGILTGEGKFSSPVTGGLVLLAVGLCEFSTLMVAEEKGAKSRYLADHSSPLLSGLCHGHSTLPRCLAMIGLQFVGGAMNVAWMVTLTLWMLLEATLPWKRHMATFTGVAMLTAGGFALFGTIV
jgi:predicted metal-binding membrane protein